MQQRLNEGLSYFEYNLEQSMILQGGPQAAERLKQNQQRPKQAPPASFGPIGIYEFPPSRSTESAPRPTLRQATETTYNQSGLRPIGRTLQETAYTPVLQAIPNTFEKRKAPEDNTTPAPTITPEPTSKPSSSSQPAHPNHSEVRGNESWQYVQIEGSDVVFARRLAQGESPVTKRPDGIRSLRHPHISTAQRTATPSPVDLRPVPADN